MCVCMSMCVSVYVWMCVCELVGGVCECVVCMSMGCVCERVWAAVCVCVHVGDACVWAFGTPPASPPLGPWCSVTVETVSALPPCPSAAAKCCMSCFGGLLLRLTPCDPVLLVPPQPLPLSFTTLTTAVDSIFQGAAGKDPSVQPSHLPADRSCRITKMKGW